MVVTTSGEVWALRAGSECPLIINSPCHPRSIACTILDTIDRKIFAVSNHLHCLECGVVWTSVLNEQSFYGDFLHSRLLRYERFSYFEMESSHSCSFGLMKGATYYLLLFAIRFLSRDWRPLF